jgi:hypothetical protein
MPRNLLRTLLGHLAKAASALSEKEVRAVLDGRARIELHLVEVVKPRAKERVPPARRTEIDTGTLKEAVHRLRQMLTREDGRDYLLTHFGTKEELVLLARSVDVPVRDRDPRSSIEDKVIDATIGFRLRSDAIQNRSRSGD